MTSTFDYATMTPETAAAALAELLPGDTLETSAGVRAHRGRNGEYELASPAHDPMTTLLISTAARYLSAAHRVIERQMIAA